MNELHLFAGAGGGILGGMLLGHTCRVRLHRRTLCKMSILNYERFSHEIWRHIKTFGDEKVLVCHAFRWHLNGQALSHAYEMFPAESICRDNGLEIVTKISDDLMVVRPKELSANETKKI